MGDDDHTSDKGSKHQGPEHASPYPLSRLAAPIDLVDAAREIEKADETIRSHVGSKLRVIVEQMRALRDQAQSVMEEAHRDAELHRAVCRFQKRPGRIYHLYRKPDDSLYFSMLSPEDWGQAPPHSYEGSYRLEADMSWTPAEKIGEQEQTDAAITHLLSS
ncbi:MAG: DUF2452 domain-containing protein [Myxococcota bacterium]